MKYKKKTIIRKCGKNDVKVGVDKIKREKNIWAYFQMLAKFPSSCASIGT